MSKTIGYPSEEVAVTVLTSLEVVAGDRFEMSDVMLSLSIKWWRKSESKRG